MKNLCHILWRIISEILIISIIQKPLSARKESIDSFNKKFWYIFISKPCFQKKQRWQKNAEQVIVSTVIGNLQCKTQKGKSILSFSDINARLIIEFWLKRGGENQNNKNTPINIFFYTFNFKKLKKTLYITKKGLW